MKSGNLLKVFETPPSYFIKRVSVASCFLEWHEKVFLLKRLPNDSHGNSWCLPGGEIEKDETAMAGAIREVYEETGMVLKKERLISFNKLYLHRVSPPCGCIFSIYYFAFSSQPSFYVDPKEHSEGNWFSFDEALKLPLIEGGSFVLNYCLKKRASLSS